MQQPGSSTLVAIRLVTIALGLTAATRIVAVVVEQPLAAATRNMVGSKYGMVHVCVNVRCENGVIIVMVESACLLVRTRRSSFLSGFY